MEPDNDFIGLKKRQGPIHSVDNPTLFYFPATADDPGHVAWMIGSQYISLSPGKKTLVPGAKKVTSANGAVRYEDGVTFNLWRPLHEAPSISTLSITRAKDPRELYEMTKFEHYWTLDMPELFNDDALDRFVRYLFDGETNNWKKKTPYIVHDAEYYNKKGTLSHIKRNNCVSMSLAVFVVGIFNQPMPEKFAAKYPQFIGVNKFLKKAGGWSNAVGFVQRYLRHPAMDTFGKMPPVDWVPKPPKILTKEETEEKERKLKEGRDAMANRPKNPVYPDIQKAGLERVNANKRLDTKFVNRFRYVRFVKELARDYKNMRGTV